MSTCPTVSNIETDEDLDPFEVIESPTMLQISIGIGANYNPALAERLMSAVSDVIGGLKGELSDLIEEHISDVYWMETLEEVVDTTESVVPPKWLH